MREWHIPRIRALIEGGVDLLAIETIPCRMEAEMLVKYLKEFPDMKAWLAFSVSVSYCNQLVKVTKTTFWHKFKNDRGICYIK